MHIILGLLMPQVGTLLVAGIPITLRNVVSWQKHLGYVPQHIYLADDTLVANIAFGVAPKDLDLDRVEYAAQVANLCNATRNSIPVLRKPGFDRGLSPDTLLQLSRAVSVPSLAMRRNRLFLSRSSP